MEQDPETAIGRKLLRRLVPPSAVFTLVGAIDRANMGFGALQPQTGTDRVRGEMAGRR